jgi:N-acetylmuramate 1-kinase
MASSSQSGTAASEISRNGSWQPHAEALLRGLDPTAPKLTWHPILHGGSSREFFRVTGSPSKSWILMRYDEAKEENFLYADIAQFLTSIHLQVPKIYFHEAQYRLVGIEDLGEASLHALVHSDPDSPKVELLYRGALHQAQILHQQKSSPIRTMPGFDEKLYQWERNYFLDHSVERCFGVSLPEKEKNQIQAEGDRMIQDLISTERSLIHRDFQSQNLIIHQDTVWMIDFQGMRLGHAAYDVASLLYDPYVELGSDRRKALVQWYASISRRDVQKFETEFYQAASQRLMQALGAYGYLGLVLGKKDFLKHIPQGLKNLKDALQHLDGMTYTKELLVKLEEKKPALAL